MAAKSREYIFSVLVGLLALATRGLGSNISVDWTLQGILSTYPEGETLELNINDTLTFNCSEGIFANAFFLSESDANECRCEGDSSTCQFLGECRNSSRQFVSPIQTASGTAMSLVSYRPGETYYFASFANSSIPRSFTSRSGGECKLGFRLRVTVSMRERDSTSPTSPPASSPPSSKEPTDPSRSPSRIPTVPGVVDRPSTGGLIGGVASTSPKLLTYVSIVLCAIVAIMFRH